jgi:hypothetical protein
LVIAFTVVHTKAEQDLAKWESHATGALLTELENNHDRASR